MNLSTTTRPIAATLRMRLSAVAIAIASAAGTAVAAPPAAEAPYLLYLPSNTPRVDHPAIIQAFIDQGFNVRTFAYAGEDDADYARRIAGEIRELLAQGVAPQDINVVGGGTGSAVALLASAATGNRHVDYVVLGQCDDMLKVRYRFRLAGNVLGIRDAADAGSGSCRAFWSGAPKLRSQRDLVLHTGYGAALFDAPRAEWLQPLVEWTNGGQVDVGAVRVVVEDAGRGRDGSAGR